MKPQPQEMARFNLQHGLPEVLPDYLPKQRWFGGKARTIQAVDVQDVIPMPTPIRVAYWALCRVRYAEADTAVYAVPLLPMSRDLTQGERPVSVVRLPAAAKDGVTLFSDAMWDQGFASSLLDFIAEGRELRGQKGRLVGSPTRAYDRLRGDRRQPLSSSVLGAEQSNTSIRYQDRLILKLFRHVERGNNPEVEIGTFLTERTSYSHFPVAAGTLAYVEEGREPASVAILQQFVPNRGDAWKTTLGSLREYIERAGALGGTPRVPSTSLLDLSRTEPTAVVRERIGKYLESAAMLGKRTAELHLALASDPQDAAFAPEAVTAEYVRNVSERMKGLSGNVFGLLSSRFSGLPSKAKSLAQTTLEQEPEIQARFSRLTEATITAARTRIHGDYHLGQVLDTGEDFVVIDFEGEPARSLEERRAKRSPLADVAGMLRSFHYAAHTAMLQQADGATERSPRSQLEVCARYWQAWVSSAFLHSYFRTAGRAAFLPHNAAELSALLQACLLEKAVYELGYELNNRPDWVTIPLAGILQVLGVRGARG